MTARLAAERANLFFQLRGLDEDALRSPILPDGCSAAELLFHLGYHDAHAAAQIYHLIEGRREAVHALENCHEKTLHNNSPDFHGDDQAERAENRDMRGREWSVSDSLAVCLKERNGLIRALQQVPEEAMFKRVYIRNGWRVSPYTWAHGQWKHDAHHSAELLKARATFPPHRLKVSPAPRGILAGLLRATRMEFLTIADLMPNPQHRETRPLVGHWTLKNILSHVTIFEQFGVTALRQLQAGQTPTFAQSIANFDTFNEAQMTLRHGHPWGNVVDGYQSTRKELLALLETTPDETLAVVFRSPWGSAITAYRLLVALAIHEQEHADAIRQGLNLGRLPKRARIFRG